MLNQSKSILNEIQLKLQDFILNGDLQINSRNIRSGDIFCAYRGTYVDGRDFIDEAIKNGASFILYEPFNNNEDLAFDVPSLAVYNLKYYVGLLASWKYNYPSRQIYTVGITGTNGKTSVSHWLAQAYNLVNEKVGVIGTIGCGIYPALEYSHSTTPGPVYLQHAFAGFVKAGVNSVAMEVSSHALDQWRVSGIEFNQAIFTNLTQDHLDYHSTMEDYYCAKKRLFDSFKLDIAIINVDDVYGIRLHQELSSDIKQITYGISENADVKATDVNFDLSGIKFKLHYKGDTVDVSTPIIGKFNLYNLLAVCSSILSRGYNINFVAQIIAKLTPVVGRLETLYLANNVLVVIDFAHTPDALENALKTLRDIKSDGDLYCVFGCGGNRDKSKRPIMGKIAATLADNVVITSDNPRYEVPMDIIKEIFSGIDITLNDRSKIKLIIDRKDAIETALKMAKSGDVVLIAGKGHETYQEIDGKQHPFSDIEVVSMLSNLHKKGKI